MKTQTQKIILGGGGDSHQSKEVDDFFKKQLPAQAKILYIPVAWKNADFSACEAWFKATYIEDTSFEYEVALESELRTLKAGGVEAFDAVYIGGGNTFHLLATFRGTGFDAILSEYIRNGGVVYGGSAGAIVLGSTVETAGLGADGDANDAGLEDFTGLSLILDMGVQCHYENSQDSELSAFAKEKGIPVIAIPEEGGVYVENEAAYNIGKEPAFVFHQNSEKKEVKWYSDKE